MLDLRCRRRPAHVHAPKTKRELVRQLIQFDDKRRESIFREVHYLLYEPKTRILKCLQYAENPKMTWLIYRLALSDLFTVNLPIVHTSDVDRTIELFLLLRRYTFEVPMKQLKQLLDQGTFEGNILSFRTRKAILEIAEKISKGITPKSSTKGSGWDINRIDHWIEQARKEFKTALPSRSLLGDPGEGGA